MNIMESTNEKTIDNIKDDSVVCLTATVKSRTNVRSWNRNKSSGKMMTGILTDNTGCIDFVCWTEGCNKFDAVLKEGKTFMFTNAKVTLAKNSYSKSKHVFQIILDQNVEIKETMVAPLIPAITIQPIKTLISLENYSLVNVFGKVVSLPPKEKLFPTGTDIIKCRIQDNTGTIQLSLLGQETQRCNFNLNDTILLENIEMRVYGNLRVLQGHTGIRTVNPIDRDYSQYLPSSQTPNSDLSPPKQEPREKTAVTLDKNDGRQKLTCAVVQTNIKTCLYERCPKVTCRTRVVQMNNGNYKCNNCEFDYLICSVGIRLVLEISEDKTSKKLLMFNDMAESFLGKNGIELSEMDEKQTNSLEQELIQNKKYTFTVACARQNDEFLVESFKKTDDIISTFPNVSSVTSSTPLFHVPRSTLFKPYALQESRTCTATSSTATSSFSLTQHYDTSLPSCSTHTPDAIKFEPFKFSLQKDDEITTKTDTGSPFKFSLQKDDEITTKTDTGSPFKFSLQKDDEITTKTDTGSIHQGQAGLGLDINANLPCSSSQTPSGGEFGSFNISFNDDDQPVDLSTKEKQPPPKRYKFVRNLFSK